MEEGQEGLPVRVSQPEKGSGFHEAIGKSNFGDLKKKINESPIKDGTKARVGKAVGEYLREFGPQDARTALVNTWEGKAVLIGDLTAEQLKEVKRTLGGLQDSIFALAGGSSEKFNEKIAGRLIERFEERAREARTAGEEETAETLLSAAEEYRDLKGILLRETSEQVSPKEALEKVTLPPLPELQSPQADKFGEYLGNLNLLRDYVVSHYGEPPPFEGLTGMREEEFGKLLRNRGLPENTLIFFDQKETIPGQPRGWTQSNELDNRNLYEDLATRERVARDLMRSAEPKSPGLSADKVEFAKPG
jgi:hypothetical protein